MPFGGLIKDSKPLKKTDDFLEKVVGHSKQGSELNKAVYSLNYS